MTLIAVDGLTVRYRDPAPPVVDALTFAIDAGESVGLVGESGSGKTQTALAIMGLLPRSAQVSGSVKLDGQELLHAGARLLNRVRALRIGMIFQDPALALNPYLRIGEQLRRIVLHHRLASGAEADRRVIAMLGKAGLPDPERQFAAYPHQLSGGMRQRAMIAAALIGEPDLLVADEPTTSIDATVQAQVMSMLRDLRRETGSALLLITHDLGVVAGNCERMLVVDRGRLIESGPTASVFARPQAARTRAMIDAARHVEEPAPGVFATDRKPILEATGLSVSYFESAAGSPWRKQELKAVRPLSIELRTGETLAIVGESGSGKTSLVRAVLGLIRPNSGTITFLGRELPVTLGARALAEKGQLQLVFQDPVGSLDPSMRVVQVIGEPLATHEPTLDRAERDSRVRRMLERVGLDETLLERYPHELSGGQAQRVAIARALIMKPAVLICDEAVASLDATVRQGILALLAEEQRRSALSIIFISHDLDVVRRISHRVLVMYMGRIVERADNAALFSRPRHPYTRALLDSVPVPDPGVPPAEPALAGEAPSIVDQPHGCVFHPRCRYAVERCAAATPVEEPLGNGTVACHRAVELDLASVRA